MSRSGWCTGAYHSTRECHDHNECQRRLDAGQFDRCDCPHHEPPHD